MRRAVIFVDAGFLSKLSQYFGNGNHLKFDYVDFFKYLAEKKNLDLEKIFYYTAPPFQSNKSLKEEIIRKKGYDKFIGKFRKNALVEIREGRCQKIINQKGVVEFNQKGVDTLMALDLALVNNRFQNIQKVILITSDTDFCPAIKELINLGIEVILFTYHEKKRNSNFFLSHYLIDCCNCVEYLKKEDMLKFKLENKNERRV